MQTECKFLRKVLFFKWQALYYSMKEMKRRIFLLWLNWIAGRILYNKPKGKLLHFFLCLYKVMFVAWKRGSLKNCLFVFVCTGLKSVLFHLLCVFIFFFRMLAVTLLKIFSFSIKFAVLMHVTISTVAFFFRALLSFTLPCRLVMYMYSFVLL